MAVAELEAWERAAAANGRISPMHQRSKGPASTPAQRVLELTRLLEQTRGMLAEACHTIRQLEIADQDNTLDNDLLRSFRAGVSFAGVSMAQYWVDTFVWEAVLNENPDLMMIVELGTWTGGFSLWLHAQAEAREMEFRTYDVMRPERRIPGFVRSDVFADKEAIGEHLRRHEPLILFCDNGNKPRELSTFPEYLAHPASVVAVHDWGTETLPADVPDSLEMVYGDYCEKMGSITRFFKHRPREEPTGGAQPKARWERERGKSKT